MSSQGAGIFLWELFHFLTCFPQLTGHWLLFWEENPDIVESLYLCPPFETFVWLVCLSFLPDSVLLFRAHSKKKQGSLGAVQHHTFCSVRGITGCTRWTTPPNIFAERDRGKLWHWGCSTTWHRSEIAWWRRMLYKHR